MTRARNIERNDQGVLCESILELRQEARVHDLEEVRSRAHRKQALRDVDLAHQVSRQDCDATRHDLVRSQARAEVGSQLLQVFLIGTNRARVQRELLHLSIRQNRLP